MLRASPALEVNMSTTLTVILLAVIAVAAVAGFLYMQKRRTLRLKNRFGPEYERTMHEVGDRSRAERALEKRAARTAKYDIRPIPADQRDSLSEEWRRTQALFVDDPNTAIAEADRLVCDVMRRSGYPMTDFDQRAEDLSVDHPHVVKNYRAAHEIAIANEQGKATTEDKRKAMVYYRDLFDELLETQPAGHKARR
jgi:hypothetical protein